MLCVFPHRDHVTDFVGHKIPLWWPKVIAVTDLSYDTNINLIFFLFWIYIYFF